MSRCATNLPWGYQEIAQSSSSNSHQVSSSEAQQQMQYANLPAALLSTLKREKKPFTYTPGGVNLSEVLEARLQKRMERKKKYMEEMEQDQQDNHRRNQVLVVSPTYNSPLNMYSVENALETLEVQAQMAANRSPSSTLPRNYKFKPQEDEDFEPSQSKAFRVLQVMTDTEVGSRKQKDGAAMSEMRWTGIREGKTTNPSRFFHTLQKITGTEVDEEEQDRQESTRFEKQTTPMQATPMCTPPVPASHVVPMHHQTPPAHAPTLQQSPSFGYAPKLKRPAAFLPKQQPWSYTRLPAATPVGTDF